MIKVLLIDIDNTLLSFSAFVKATIKSGFEKYQLMPYNEDIFPVFERINNSLWRRLEQGELTQKQIEAVRWNMVFEELGIDFDGVAFERYFKEQLFVCAIPEPNAIEFLQYLEPKYMLCTASNGPYVQQLNRLEIGEMYGYFDHHFISEKVGAEKPSKAFFEYAFREIQEGGFGDLKPEETMIIGDSCTSDMAGGKNYGMQTCLYTRGRKMESKPENVDYIIENLMDITAIL